MNDGAEIINFVGEQFRRLNLRFDRLELEIGDMNGRMIVVGEGIASMSARIASVEVSTARMIKPVDRVENRLKRIERRLNLVDLR